MEVIAAIAQHDVNSHVNMRIRFCKHLENSPSVHWLNRSALSSVLGRASQAILKQF